MRITLNKEGKASFRFRPNEHLKGRNRIKGVFGKGKRFYSEDSTLFVLPNNLSYNCICFSFSKGRKFGNAVERNRAKRLAREAYRLMRGAGEIASGYDLILLINSKTDTLKERMMNLKFLFKKAGLLIKG